MTQSSCQDRARPNSGRPEALPVRAALSIVLLLGGASAAWARHPVPREHPRLLGSRQELVELSRQRPEAYRRVVEVARGGEADDHSKIISMALVAVIDGDAELARQCKQMAMKYVEGPIRRGHVTFGHDLALSAIAYDLCHAAWSPAERAKFHQYVNETVDANVQSETHVFHNAWYSYKNWGIGLAGYAGYYENPRAREILKTLEDDYLRRAAPALELSGAGGGFAEGYYIHYWLYEWLFFCEAARRCEGVDYYAAAPNFYGQRAIASMFEQYPGIGQYGSRRSVPMGDGGGRTFGGDRDKALSARRILVNFFRDDMAHQAVHAFNESTPRSAVGTYAYKDFLWRDIAIPKGDPAGMKLSHYSPGPGYVYARSSWDEDATYFYFKCGDRFTAHQHLDVGHFLIYRHEELAGDGGHYDDFGSRHDVNYHLRTIAHSTLLVHDPGETWKGIRAGEVTGNDGGQTHSWRHHNGATSDVEDWRKQYDACHIAQMLAFEDRGAYLYVAGDATRAYSRRKIELFTRQIVFLRPGTFVIFDRVRSTRPELAKTWLLQAMKPPGGEAPNLVVTNGKGRLFVQTVLPEGAQVRLAAGEELYRYGGQSYPPRRNTGPAPECRIEISPPRPARSDTFLHVLTAADAGVESVPTAAAEVTAKEVLVTLGKVKLGFTTDEVGGFIEREGKRTALGGRLHAPEAPKP